MKSRFILFRRAGVFYCEDTTTRKQSSLKTKDKTEALALLQARNESFRQTDLNTQIAMAYLSANRHQVFHGPTLSNQRLSGKWNERGSRFRPFEGCRRIFLGAI